MGGFGLGNRANIPVSGGSSLLLDRSPKRSKVGIKKSEVMELLSARKSSDTLDCSSEVSGSYQSAGHGTHSQKESRDISSGSFCSELGK